MTRGVTGTSAGGQSLGPATALAMTAPSFRLPVGPAHLPAPRATAVGSEYPLARARRAFVTATPPRDSLRRDQPPAPVGAALRFCTLGTALVQVGAAQITPASGILFSLLVRLAHAPGLGVSRERLVAELWPGHDPFRQRANLRQALYKLRAMGVRVGIGGELVALDPRQLQPSFALTRTAEAFEARVLSGAEPFGPFLPGVSGEGEFAEWLEQQREVVHAELRRLLVEVLRGRRARGDWGGTEVVARALLQLDPLNEEGTLLLAECTLLAGARPEALRLLDRYLEEVGELPDEVRRRVAALRRRIHQPPLQPARVREAPLDDRLFLGRDAELAELTMALRRARWQDGSAVLVHGAPGIGKTRLTQELGRVATIEGFRELRLACREGDETSGYQLLSTLVQQLLALPGALGCSPEGLRRLRQQWPERGAPATEGRGPIDAVEQAATREALVDLVTAIAEERPLVMVVEDVHWVDAGSWQVLQLFAGVAASSRLFLLFTSRERSPAHLRTVALAPRLAVLGVEPLAGEPLTALSGALVGMMGRGGGAEAGAGHALTAQLASVSQGNPLFLRALVQHWADTGEVEGIPGTLTGLLETRMNRLREPTLMVLQAIGLLGALATTERLVAVLGVPTSALLASLEELAQADCIRSAPPNHVASHDLVNRAALGRLSAAGAAVLRGAIADALLAELRLTRRGGDGVTSGASGLLLAVLEQLALSGRWPKWGMVLEEEQAGVLALGNPAPVLSQAASAGVQAPEVVGWSGVRGVLAQLQGQAGNYEESLRLAGDVASLAGMVSGLGEREATALLGYFDSAIESDLTADPEFLAEGLAQLAELESLPTALRQVAASRGLIAASNLVSPRIAGRCYGVIRAGEPSSVQEARLRDYNMMIYHVSFGDVAEGLYCANKLLLYCLNEHHTANDLSLVGNVGYALRFCGRTEEAIAVLSRSYDCASKLGLPIKAAFPAWQLAALFFQRKQQAQFKEWLTVCSGIREVFPDVPSLSYLDGFLFRMAAFEGDLSSAQRYFDALVVGLSSKPTMNASGFQIACELTLGLLDPSWLPTEASISSLASWIQGSSALLFSDFLASAVTYGMLRLNHTSRAEEFLADYLKRVRREVGPPGREIQQILQDNPLLFRSYQLRSLLGD
jgi:DNA-binding SARP family transcriptional activator